MFASGTVALSHPRSAAGHAAGGELPGIAMVGKAPGWRVTWTTAGLDLVGGVVAGGLLALL